MKVLNVNYTYICKRAYVNKSNHIKLKQCNRLYRLRRNNEKVINYLCK